MTEDIKEINKKALEKVSLAQEILDKLKINPQLAYYHDPLLSKLGESRCSRHFVYDNLYDIFNMYSTNNPNDLPVQVKKFVEDANLFFYGGRN